MNKIIVLNPGATSTKVAYYLGEQEIFGETLDHAAEDLQQYTRIADQLDYRYAQIISVLEDKGVNLSEIDAIAARGGLLPPVKAGAYEVNEAMIDFLINRPRVHHASNLGAIIADKLKKHCSPKTKAFVYDPVTVDEYSEISRISGLATIPRESIGHALNMRAVAMEIAQKRQQPYEASNFIVAHLGGGNSVSLHRAGQMIDSLSDDEGPFSTERTGGLPVKHVIALAYQHEPAEMERLTRKVGGMYSYLGTNDARIVEKRIAAGDEKAALIYRALASQVAKGIGSLATVVAGAVDGIIITGGLARSELLMTEIEQAVSFIAPVYFVPGEREMYALATGINRVLEGQEIPHVFNE